MILLVIDMQKCIVDDELYAFESFMDNTIRLVDAARKNGVEVVFVQHDAIAGRKGLCQDDQQLLQQPGFQGIHGAAGGQTADDRRPADQLLHRRHRKIRF